MKQTGFSLKNNTQRYALTGILFGLLFPVLATIIYILDTGLSFSLSSVVAVQSTEPLLWIIDTAPVFLGFFAAIAGRRQDELEKTNHMLRLREQELEAAQFALEQRVTERTQQLTSLNQTLLERTEQLNSIVDLARSLLSIQKLDHLLTLVVQMISQQFNYYHVGVYLLDEKKQYAMLLAANSEGGLRIIQRGGHFKISEQSLVGLSIRSGQPHLMSDADKDPVFRREPELSSTRSELVLPLTSGHIVIGALDLQSDTTRIFTQEYISVLSILADLVAIAIQNSMLHEKTQRTLHEVEVNSRQTSARAWSSWVESIQTRGYRYDGIRAEPLNKEEPLDTSQIRIKSIPIHLRGQIIGSLKIKLSETSQSWTEDDNAIAQATAERAALAFEGARLVDEAKRRAARESFLSDMAAKLGTSFQLETILRDTVEELGQTLDGSTVSFQLINPNYPKSMGSTKSDGSPFKSQDME